MNKKYIYKILPIIFLFIVGCSQDSAIGPTDSGGSAIAGSYARMLAIGSNLYVLEESNLTTLDITEPEVPVKISTIQVGENIETIFFNGVHLFIGSNDGLYIFSLGNNGEPNFESLTRYEDFGNILPCDPVVANQTHAFVTLSTSSLVADPSNTCARFEQINQLRVYDINDVSMAFEVSITEMESPKGLALDGHYLFVCEENNGLKVFNVNDVENPVQINHFPGYEAYDVIAYNGLLMVVSPTEIYQYDYTDISNIQLLSIIEK